MGRIGEVATANWAYHNHDALGSLRQLTDSDGTVTLTKSYRPYGDELSSSGVGTSSYGFTGEMQDMATGLVYLRARYYAPWDGRFTQQDPSRLEQNLYLYASANPINLTDPSGLHAGFHSQYCDPLIGKDRDTCERIVRGISLDIPGPLSIMKLYDLCLIYGDGCHRSCDLPNGYGPLVLPPKKDLRYTDAVPYGYYFHDFMNTELGWWNQNGYGHVNFRAVVAHALGLELHTAHDDPKVKEGMELAFAHKSWREGFYRMIGGRASVQFIVNIALFGNPEGGSTKYANPEEARRLLDKANLRPGTVAYTSANRILDELTYYTDNTPYEWANVTSDSSDPFMEWINRDAPIDPIDEDALWYVYGRNGDPYNVGTLYILNYRQAQYLSKLFPAGSRGLDGDS